MEFDFFQQWYPLSPLEDLDIHKPTAVTLLGISLVIWKPAASETFKVFSNQCPHRLAPLSEGRVDDKTGNLMCSYHGWEFNQEGICTRIPQIDNPELVSENQQDFCVKVFPSLQANDLLWVWADANSPEQAAQTPLPLSPQINAEQGFVWSSMVRDLEYDWSTLIENVADPSHVSFAHHGVQGNREKARPLPLKIVESNLELIQATTNVPFATTITFQPPCRLEYQMNFGTEGKQIGLITYCLPVEPGKSRIVAQFSRNFAKKLALLTPRWWNHLQVRNEVLDGDMILLHQQEDFLQQRQKQESWKTAYKMPASCDRLVIEFRSWFDRYCQGKLPWEQVGVTVPETPVLNSDRQIILDRYHQHTQHCSSCRGALKNIQLLQGVLVVYFIISLSTVALLPDSLRFQVGLPLILLALSGLATGAWLRFRLQPKFYFVDYLHGER